MEKAIEWVKNHKPHTAAIAIVVVAVIAVSIAAASGAFTQQDKTTADEQKTVDVTLSVTADHGWDENSTPAIAHIEGNDVDFYHAVTPDAEGNKGTSTVALAEGDYTVSFVSPVNSDGSAFDIYDTGAPVDITVDADAKTAPAVNCPMAQIPADKVTDDMLADIVDKTKDAIKKGDETLKGDAGTGILDKLDGNVAKNPNASDKTKQEATDADKDVDVNDKPAQTTPSAKNDGNKTDSNAGSQSSSNGSSNAGSASSKPSQSSQPSKPAHTHTWVNHTATRQVWVSNWVDVPDYGTQQVQTGTRWVFPEDGYVTTSLSDAKAHAVALVKQGCMGNYHTEPVYENQTVQTGSHKEDHGSYTTETYVDYVYCSSCGAHQ
jgi:Ni/Co efflux regulator RcnB